MGLFIKIHQQIDIAVRAFFHSGPGTEQPGPDDRLFGKGTLNSCDDIDAILVDLPDFFQNPGAHIAPACIPKYPVSIYRIHLEGTLEFFVKGGIVKMKEVPVYDKIHQFLFEGRNTNSVEGENRRVCNKGFYNNGVSEVLSDRYRFFKRIHIWKGGTQRN